MNQKSKGKYLTRYKCIELSKTEASAPSKMVNGKSQGHGERPPSTVPPGEQRKETGRANTDGGEGKIRVSVNMRGLYSVCVRLEDFHGQQRVPGYIEV